MSQLLPPTDGTNVRDMIQSVVDREGVAHLGPGRFVIDGKSPSSRWDCLQLRGGQSIIGSGPSTILEFRGEGITVNPVTGVQSGDWRGIGITGDDNMVADLGIDTGALTKTSEQTHAMSVIGRARHTTIRNIMFRHPVRRNQDGIALPGGDCVKIGGYISNNTPVSAIIEGCHFIEADRSGIASIGGFEALIIRGCIFYDTSDQDVDIEAPIGEGGNVLCDGNIHLWNPARKNGLAMQIAFKFGLNVTVTDCIFDGRGVFFGGLHRLTMNGCTIIHKTSGAPTLDIVKSNDDVKIVGCTIIRESSALPNSLVKIQHHHSGMSGSVSIQGCDLRNETASPSILNAQSMKRLKLVGNTFEWRPTEVPAGTTHTLVSLATLAQRCESLTATSNEFIGPAHRALQFDDKNKGLGLVTLAGNTAPMPIYVQRVTKTETGQLVPFGPVVSSGNNWPAPIGGFADFEPGR